MIEGARPARISTVWQPHVQVQCPSFTSCGEGSPGAPEFARLPGAMLSEWNILEREVCMKIITLLPFLVTAAFVQPLPAQTAASCAPAGNIQFVCGQDGPEDLLHLPGSDWVIASVMAGNGGIHLISVQGKTSTLLYPSSSAKEQWDKKTYDTCPGPPEPDDKVKFTTHGLAMQTVRNSIYTLYAVHHGKRESIEVFQIDARGKTPALTWI